MHFKVSSDLLSLLYTDDVGNRCSRFMSQRGRTYVPHKAPGQGIELYAQQWRLISMLFASASEPLHKTSTSLIFIIYYTF